MEQEAEKEAEIPSLAIKSISHYGVLEIEFSLSMMPTNLAYFNDTSVELTPISEYEGQVERMEFTWSATEFVDKTLLI